MNNQHTANETITTELGDITLINRVQDKTLFIVQSTDVIEVEADQLVQLRDRLNSIIAEMEL